MPERVADTMGTTVATSTVSLGMGPSDASVIDRSRFNAVDSGLKSRARHCKFGYIDWGSDDGDHL